MYFYVYPISIYDLAILLCPTYINKNFTCAKFSMYFISTLSQQFQYIYLRPSYFTMSDLYQQKFYMCKILNVYFVYPVSTILVYLSMTQLFYYALPISTNKSQCANVSIHLLCLTFPNNVSICLIYDLAVLLCMIYLTSHDLSMTQNKHDLSMILNPESQSQPRLKLNLNLNSLWL